MGKKSGVDNVALWSDKLGITLDKDEIMEGLNQVKQRSHDLKRVLTEDEFREITQHVKAEKR